MDRRYEVRKAELLAGCKLSPDELEGAREVGERIGEPDGVIA